MQLPRSGAWFLKRPVPGCDWFDAMGCYPYLVCQDWSELEHDLDALQGQVVSFAAAPDPFGAYTVDGLKRAFRDVTVHVKDHYVADLTQPLTSIVSTHHRKSAERALRRLEVQCYSEASGIFEEVASLFEKTARRLRLQGIRAFTRESIAQQLALPGCFASIARHDGIPVAAHMQLVHAGTAYAHLAGADERANALGASYALYYSEIQYFMGKVQWLDWGGDAGVGGQQTGLGRFKRGWSNLTKPAYFCGRILEPQRYEAIVHARDREQTSYFPAYRAGEFS